MKTDNKNISRMPTLKLNFKDEYIREYAKKVQFIDIETSLISALVFRAGLQTITASQIEDETKILTVAGGSLYDMQMHGIKKVWSFSNHRSSTFMLDPLDDTEVLQKVWKILDEADAIIAHNARFDQGWLHGRFLSLGWKLPSPYKVMCTYRNLNGYNMVSKKLDYLSQNLCGTRKIDTTHGLWKGCYNGDRKSFIAMEKYNVGDIYDTLYKVWTRTAYYNPKTVLDMSNPDSNIIQCRVDGGPLVKDGRYINPNTGKPYLKYYNPRSGQYYRDRYCVASKNAGLGKIVPI